MHTTTEPKRFQCRHIFTDGHRCGSPSLRREAFCFYHHTTRKPVPKQEIDQRSARRNTFSLPLPEDRSAVQHSIGEIIRRLADNTIDARRAGLILYALQIATQNLPRLQSIQPTETQTVEEIIEDPTHGPIAPEQELLEPKKARHLFSDILEELDERDRIATIQAVAEKREVHTQTQSFEDFT